MYHASMGAVYILLNVMMLALSYSNSELMIVLVPSDQVSIAMHVLQSAQMQTVRTAVRRVSELNIVQVEIHVNPLLYAASYMRELASRHRAWWLTTTVPSEKFHAIFPGPRDPSRHSPVYTKHDKPIWLGRA
ncbi:hypothetical protein KC19_3G133600 [Ceratodon purpureus]|uniref:Uncharacterized protein n=1 Tax=Ceratodon purpureus TaxID=3225 RepID=A0A8T0ILG8_CERPU|nr:hypothetical protein KC19_3G133600 [Ceratodon purpureus]